MQDEKQFEQLMLQYNQLKNSAEDISRMIKNEDFHNALTMINSREEIFLNCKCMRNYLELTPTQEKELNKLLDELRELEINNIKNEKSMYFADITFDDNSNPVEFMFEKQTFSK